MRRYHAAVWDEPLIMTQGRPGGRATVFADADPAIANAVGSADGLIPDGLRRTAAPALPEVAEHEVQRHYLRLSQETLGMMGVSLFGTCTMKYNPRLLEDLAASAAVAEVHPLQPAETMQGILAVVHGLDVALRELSGMDRFVFQAGGGADAAFTHACVTRAYHAAQGDGDRRDQVITTIQTHPCNAATAATAGYDVITLPLGEHGYPSLDALRAAISDRTAALMVCNPDDMGIYNPEIREWTRLVRDAGGLCFYDHANFNGVMGKLRARELGFDACMYMLHKTFGAPKGGGGPAAGAYGCSAELAPFLPGPLVVERDGAFAFEPGAADGAGKVREFLGNVPLILKAYAWIVAMGADGIALASDLSVLHNAYMETRLRSIRGVSISHPGIAGPRLEMTRYSLERLRDETGVTVVDVANRMTDYGIDAPWLSHEPWLVPEPFTPEAGEMYGREDIDRWIDVLERVCSEAYESPEFVRSAPHDQAVGKVDGSRLEDPAHWATTWRAFQRKLAAVGD